MRMKNIPKAIMARERKRTCPTVVPQVGSFEVRVFKIYVSIQLPHV
jgi:hypothetical protein